MWWGQSVPTEGGRSSVRGRSAAGIEREILPAPWSARSSVHEYGGGAWAASPDRVLYFVEKSDQRVWQLSPGGQPQPLTPNDGARYGGLTWQRGHLLGIRESGGAHSTRAIVEITPGGESAVTVLADGTDFLAQPALSPDGTQLAWMGWDHPNMPWDHTTVFVATLPASPGAQPRTPRAVTSGQTAALQPVWLSDSELVVADDPTGRWNLWGIDLEAEPEKAVPIAPDDSDTGGGLWVLDASWYAALEAGQIVAARTNGRSELVLIEPDGQVRPLPAPPTDRVVIEDAAGSRVLVSGLAPSGGGVWLIDAADLSVTQIAGAPDPRAEQWIPIGMPVSFDGPHGTVHAFEFEPKHPLVSGPRGQAAPYIVFVHGGPTSHVGGVAGARTAFFTSRGIGVLDVNYGGSTGYGRAYRERLRGQWGIVDVDDVAAAARGLVATGRADPARLAISGGSAGGWTVLAALAATDLFGAGLSRYGVADARSLAADTHDFESRYLDSLIGPLPEAESVYIERSPLTHADRFRAPVLLLQGDEDRVVPPAQSEAIRDALAAHGIAHAYVLYAGEGHGFRRTDTLINALESEYAFLGQVFGFETPGVAPIPLS